MNKLRNVISLRTKNLSKRIQRALDELADVLANEQPVPVPIPVRIPVRGRPVATRFQHFGPCVSEFRRCFSSFANSGADQFFKFNHFPNLHNFRGNHVFGKYKWFFKFSGRFMHNKAGSNMFRSCVQKSGNGFMFSNFAQAHQNSFRWNIYSKNLKLSYRNIICQIKDKTSELELNKESPSILQTINKYELASSLAGFSNVRLNISLSPKHHKITLDLARTESSAPREDMYEQINGSYIEFPINFNFSIPDETILNDEVLDELLVNVKHFQNRLAEFKSDIVGLFELGELPIKYIKDRQVLRVYFPNCDFQKLEMLCREKNVTGGTIFEDFGENVGVPQSTEPVSSENILATDSDVLSDSMSASASTVVSSEDILSSSLYESDDSMSSSYSFDEDDVISHSIVHPLSNEEIIRLDYVAQPTEVSIHSDDYYWVAA